MPYEVSISEHVSPETTVCLILHKSPLSQTHHAVTLVSTYHSKQFDVLPVGVGAGGLAKVDVVLAAVAFQATVGQTQ